MTTKHEHGTRISFSDGMTFNTGGGLRVVERSDGWYVVGRGMLIPVADHAEGARMVAGMQGARA